MINTDTFLKNNGYIETGEKMAETIKLYYKDAYIQAFNAVVEDCAPRDDKYAVTLDRTAFYPEGGGQPGDIGLLNDAVVSDTIEEEETIILRI